MASAAPAATFRTIGELAQLCGQYCWAETRLFEVTGEWASGDGPDEWRVFCSVGSGLHAALASEWRARLPVRAGVDQAALVVQPPGPLGSGIEALTLGVALGDGLPALLGDVLPNLVALYAQTLREASPVSEAPVMALLARAIGWHAERIDIGRVLLQ